MKLRVVLIAFVSSCRTASLTGTHQTSLLAAVVGRRNCTGRPWSSRCVRHCRFTFL